jgi:diguanylate cyclase (GGDEF)-like protein
MALPQRVSTTRMGRLIWPISVVMLIVSLMLVALTLYSGREMDRQAVESQRALVDNTLTSRLRRGLGELRSVAWWDDAVKYSSAQGFDQVWLDREIGSYMNESYHHDRVAILDEHDRPVYSYGADNGIGSVGLKRDIKAADAILKQARGGSDVSPRVETTAKHGELYETAKFNGRRYGRGFGAIVAIDGRPALALASLITPSFDTSLHPPRRRIVMTIIEITPEVLREIGREVLMPDLGFATASDSRGGAYELRTDGTSIHLATLRWSPKQPGTELVKRVLPYILGALLIAGLIMVFLVLRIFASAARLARGEKEAQQLANHDALTGLPNRRMLRSEYERLSLDEEGRERQIAVVCLDLDHFKDINDTLGHQAGDALINAVAQRLSGAIEPEDVLARLGGDELAILRMCFSAECTERLARELEGCFSKPFEVIGHQIEANASIGLSVVSPTFAFDEAMREADIALYEAKANGRGQVVKFVPTMATKLERRHALEVDLRRALTEDELEMHYQPIVEATTGVISTVEALVRWTSPTQGSVPPDVFVSIAEEAGMMADLGRFVIQRAMRDSKRWPNIKTAINISAAQLRSATILSDLLEPARLWGIDPRQITIEITESVLMANDERTLRRLAILKERGFSLSLDDFGTGYSSLSYLRDFPFDKLKIDRSFVKGLEGSERGLAIVKSMVNFGHILGREIIAEGIETEQEMQIMQAAGCTHLQGFLFSKALPADHIEAMAATVGRLSAKRDERPAVAPLRVGNRALG